MSRRREQRESVLMRATQEVLARGLADPRIRGLITVTDIRLTEDGKQAFVSVSILPEERAELTMHGLRAATKHIRRDVADRIRIREMPAMEFRLDGSIKEQAGVLAAINRAASDRPEPARPEQDRDEPANQPAEGLEPDTTRANDDTPHGDHGAPGPEQRGPRQGRDPGHRHGQGPDE